MILSLLLLKYLGSVLICVSLCLPPSLILKTCLSSSLLLYFYHFGFLDLKNLFSSCVSAFSKWLLTSSLCRILARHRGKMMPSEKPKSKGERVTSPQTKWSEVYNAKCHTPGDPSTASPPFLFSPALLRSATCKLAECRKYLSSSLL